jgi:hypothetical protein
MFTRQWFTVDAGIHSVEAGPVRLAEAAAMSLSARGLLALILATAWVVTAITPAGASPAPATGHYDHIFVIVEENHGFTDVIGNPAAPNLNALASQYGIATNIERNFGLSCLQHACDADVKPLALLFAVTGSAASPFRPLPEPQIAAPAPAPAERVSYVTDNTQSAGWAVQPAPALGTNDSTYGTVAAVSPADVWAADNFLPDTPDSNQDATLATAAHFDGSTWTQTPVPDSGPNFNTLFGVAATPGRAWAVGVDGAWSAELPAGLGTAFSNLTGVAVADGTAWAVGSAFDAASGNQLTLVARHTRGGWKQVAAPNPGTGDRVLGGISSAGAAVWAAGFFETDVARSPLIELHK